MWRKKKKIVFFRWHKFEGLYPRLPKEMETVLLCFENVYGTRDYITAFQNEGRWYNQNTGNPISKDYDDTWKFKAWKIEPVD